MCDTTFTFGQRGNHFFQSPSKQDYTRLPKKLTALLTSAQLQKVHHVTLGYESSFLLTWRDTVGHDHINSQGLPTELNNFIYASNAQGFPSRIIPKLRLTLGPYNSSFLVHDSSAYLWMNLPPSLLVALQSRIQNGNWIDKPRIVALGADQNFLLLTERNAAVWDLGNYPMISKMLEFSKTQAHGIEEVQNIALHPYRYQCFLAQSRNGTLIHENLPPHELSGIQIMMAAILHDTRELERMMDTNRRVDISRRPSLKPAASLRKDWGDDGDGEVRKQRFTAKGQGLRLSLSLSVSAKGTKGISGAFGLGSILG